MSMMSITIEDLRRLNLREYALKQLINESRCDILPKIVYKAALFAMGQKNPASMMVDDIEAVLIDKNIRKAREYGRFFTNNLVNLNGFKSELGDQWNQVQKAAAGLIIGYKYRWLCDEMCLLGCTLNDNNYFCLSNRMRKAKREHLLYPLPNYRVDHIPTTTPHDRRPGTTMIPEYLTIHSTGNENSTAKNERAWLTNTENNLTASFHLVVDENNVIECLPFNEMAWHSGDGTSGTGNSKSIGLEICESGNRKKTLENAVALAAKVLKDHGWNESKLMQHYDWINRKGGRKKCPRIFILPEYRKDKRQTWEWFKSEVKCQLQCKG
jgi:N-acetylmuramoyl-L-alanine amidase